MHRGTWYQALAWGLSKKLVASRSFSLYFSIFDTASRMALQFKWRRKGLSMILVYSYSFFILLTGEIP